MTTGTSIVVSVNQLILNPLMNAMTGIVPSVTNYLSTEGSTDYYHRIAATVQSATRAFVVIAYTAFRIMAVSAVCVTNFGSSDSHTL